MGLNYSLLLICVSLYGETFLSDNLKGGISIYVEKTIAV
jgi:hypothetical protein